MFYSVALLQTLKDNQIEDISLKLLHVHTEHCNCGNFVILGAQRPLSKI